MSEQVIQRTALAIPGEPGILHIALDQAAPFQHAADAGGDLLDQRLQFVQAGTGHMPEHGWVSAIGQVHAIHEQHVKVHVQVQRRTETLHQRQRLRVGGEQEPQRMRQRQHPLPQRALGQHLIGQQCSRLGHAPRTTRRAEPALLAAEGHQLLGVALLAAHAQEALLQPPALQVGVEFLLYVVRQRSAGFGP